MGLREEDIPGLANSVSTCREEEHETISAAMQKVGALATGRKKVIGFQRRQTAIPEEYDKGRSMEFEEANKTCRMTPRTRKLTEAMQKFLSQKANLPQWQEIELGKIHPLALIGRCCKVYWPMDKEWYPGVIHTYDSEKQRHRIDYQDNEKEWVVVAKERVKLKVSADELQELESSVQSECRKKPNPDELAALAAGLENCQGTLGQGDIVWAKVKGYPMWPAFVMDEEHAKACGLEPANREGILPVQFFGSYDHARISSKKMVLFSTGLLCKYHSKCKRAAFEQGVEEVGRYLKECRLPELMTHLQDDVVGDGVHGAIERQRPATEQCGAEPDGQDFLGDERKHTIRKSVQSLFTLPLNLGTLSVLSLGKVVRDSERFHDQNHIWTEGYTAVRMYTSTRDPERMVQYKMEVLRNPCSRSMPLFRVSPADEMPIEGPSPAACWKKLYMKLQKAKEKCGIFASPEQEKRPQLRSGVAMFGFTHPRVAKLIQGLPNSRACSNFTGWLDKSPLEEGAEELLPAGYKPINVPWKHLDRCTVCYLDEEYEDNLLLQCDKCCLMVHMVCYGELETAGW